jgi:SAM-dependent methyltransferase
MWQQRDKAAVVIASRFASGAHTAIPFVRKFGARVLNHLTANLLSVPIRDLTSGYRLMWRALFVEPPLQSDGFDILVEIVVRAYVAGGHVIEVPTTYVGSRRASRRQPLAVACALVRTAWRWWQLRNSIDSADYDERAFFSWIPLQRWWHRWRHHVIMGMAHGKGLTLDVGCGSSVILPSLGQAVGLDISMAKLRFARKWGLPLVRASADALPFADESFDCVVCSQVIEHMPIDRQPLGELVRVLKPNGTLVVGTPDYATRAWRIIEPLYGTLKPGGYKDEHVTHFTRASLVRLLHLLGCRVDVTSCTFGDLTLMAIKTAAPKEPVNATTLREAGVISTGR